MEKFIETIEKEAEKKIEDSRTFPFERSEEFVGGIARTGQMPFNY